ncbi:MAG: Mur ligase family protein [Actinomycetota bacterium]|nr:Mur ligase family protein [Actinomycetota bacterium]
MSTLPLAPLPGGPVVSAVGAGEVYDAAVAALFARRPPERTARGLACIRALCAELGDPQSAFPAVHITGTNGKTTLAWMVSSLLTALNVVPGTYTSPHLQDVRERVAVGGRPLSRADFVQTLTALWPCAEQVGAFRGELVTFFETLTALAFSHFAAAGVDAAVVEVGMGGRWDATNVVDASVAVLSRVALDHAELGSTVSQVAREKVGIVKDGAVVVSAEQDPVVAEVIARAAGDHGARLAVAGRDFGVLSRTIDDDGQWLDLRGLGGDVRGVWLPLHGAHQASNAACALAAVEAFLDESDRAPSRVSGSVDADAVRAGFAAVRSPGRLERFARGGGAPVILDGAHNPAAARALAATLATEQPYRRRVVVLGALADKDVPGILRELTDVADEFVVTTAPCLRAMAAADLATVARSLGRQAHIAPDIAEALRVAAALARPDDCVVVTGSLYTVGAARTALTATRSRGS